MTMNMNNIRTLSGQYASIEDIISTPDGSHIIWKSKTESGYTLYRDGEKY